LCLGSRYNRLRRRVAPATGAASGVPLSDGEQRTLIETSASAPDQHVVGGEDRAMLHAIAAMTGLRRGEPRSPTRAASRPATGGSSNERISIVSPRCPSPAGLAAGQNVIA
jgi:hypothetical protein